MAWEINLGSVLVLSFVKWYLEYLIWERYPFLPGKIIHLIQCSNLSKQNLGIFLIMFHSWSCCISAYVWKLEMKLFFRHFFHLLGIYQEWIYICCKCPLLCCLWQFFLFPFFFFFCYCDVYQRRQWHPTPVLLPGKSHGRRSLVGYSLWGREELDTTEWLHFHFSLSCTGGGNGNLLQCSSLENPRDGSLVGCRLWGPTELDTTYVTQQQRCVYLEWALSVYLKWTVLCFTEFILCLFSLKNNIWSVWLHVWDHRLSEWWDLVPLQFQFPGNFLLRSEAALIWTGWSTK